MQLVNKLQRAAGNIGDNAASEGSGGMPSLWNLLPSIVVIGGQVNAMPLHCMLQPGCRIIVIAGCTCQFLSLTVAALAPATVHVVCCC